MEVPRWKKRIAWSLSLPFGLAISGWISVTIAETNVRAAIRVQESKLEAIGLRVEPLTDADNAAPDYRALAQAIRATGQIQETGGGGSWKGELKRGSNLMKLFRKSVQKPALVIPPATNRSNQVHKDVSLVRLWTHGLIWEDRNVTDPVTLDEIASFLSRQRLQLALAASDDWWHAFQGTEPVLDEMTFHEFSSSKVRTFLRWRLERNNTQDLISARLSGAILRSRSLLVKSAELSASGSGPLDKLKAFIERSRLFRLNIEFELMSAWTRVASEHLGNPRRVGQMRPFEELVRTSLQQRGTWFARSAQRFLKSPGYWDNRNYELDRRQKLIGLDLLDQFLARRELKPTWSSKWMTDPLTWAPLKLKLRSAGKDMATLLLSCDSPAGPWKHEYKLRTSLPQF